MSNRRVADIMVERVYWVRPCDTLATANHLMETYRIRHLPVIDDGKHLLGILSHRDLVRVVVTSGATLPLSLYVDVMDQMLVDQAMNSDVIAVSPGQSIKEAGSLLLENKISALPVVNEGRLVGIITESDFVKMVISMG